MAQHQTRSAHALDKYDPVGGRIGIEGEEGGRRKPDPTWSR